jgi:hypothetical protein
MKFNFEVRTLTCDMMTCRLGRENQNWKEAAFRPEIGKKFALHDGKYETQ